MSDGVKVAALYRRREARVPRLNDDTAALPAALQRQACSTPTLMPTRGPHTTSRLASPRSSMRSADCVRSARFCCSEIPSARDRLPGPRHSAAARHRRRRLSTPAHQPLPLDRFERADQHRGRRALRLGDRVHEVVDAVVQIDVGKAGWPVQRRVPERRSGRGMAGRVGLADVGLGLDDHARGDAASGLVHQHLPDQIRGDGEGGARVEVARQRHSARRLSTSLKAP